MKGWYIMNVEFFWNHDIDSGRYYWSLMPVDWHYSDRETIRTSVFKLPDFFSVEKDESGYLVLVCRGWLVDIVGDAWFDTDKDRVIHFRVNDMSSENNLFYTCYAVGASVKYDYRLYSDKFKVYDY